MNALILRLAKRIAPDLESLDRLTRSALLTDVFGLLYASPLAVIGLVWLSVASALTLPQANWPMLLILLGLVYLFKKLHFFLLTEIRPGVYADFSGSNSTLVTWSGALLFGPIALWLDVIWQLIEQERAEDGSRWRRLRSQTLGVAMETLGSLIALGVYRAWGGQFPLAGLSLATVLPALGATAIRFTIAILIDVPLILFASRQVIAGSDTYSTTKALVRFIATAVSLPALVEPFAVFAAGLYTQNGPGVYFAFIAAVLLASWLAHQLSQSVERSQQRSRELARLEQLGRAIIEAPPDASTLPDLLRNSLQGMLPFSQIEIRIFPDRHLLHHPAKAQPTPPHIWEWAQTLSEGKAYPPRSTLPWGEKLPAYLAMVVSPILSVAGAETIGGIVVMLRRDQAAAPHLVPAIQSLAAQVASALHRAQVYEQTLAHQRVLHELAVAGKIQASLLPERAPEIAGWEIAATLKPARETSGDFYDFIALPNGNLGIVIADVADKGTGAALFMALARTLIRTYAIEHATRPDLALGAANRRILADSHTDQFVTAFYGVLDPSAATLTYCNAGHNPAYYFYAPDATEAQTLAHTGIPLGIFEEVTWQPKTISIAPGAALLLYTDGLTEAQDREEMQFGVRRMLDVTGAHLQHSARGIQDALLAEVQTFVGDAPQHDDITLMVVVRSSIIR